MSDQPQLNDKILIPEELRDLKQWTYSYSTAELKRPTYTRYKPNGGVSFTNALLNAGTDKYIGFYVTDKDPYILIDLDNIVKPNNPWKELPPKLSLLLKNTPTYSEISPSGNGLRFILKLKEAKEKGLLSGKNFYSCELTDNKKAKKVQVNVGPPWQTITQNITKFSSTVVKTVSLDTLDKVFRLKYKVTDLKKSPVTVFSNNAMPKLHEIKTQLMGIPLDQNERVVRGYENMTGNSYQHYAFWNHVLMSLHHYATVTNQIVECFQLADDWSQTDAENYKSSEDIRKHWESFDIQKDTKITFRSILGIHKSCHIFWPKPLPQTDTEILHKRPRKPNQKYYVNFKTLIDFYGLKLSTDTTNVNKYYVIGDRDIMQRYFCNGESKLTFNKYYGPLYPETLKDAVFKMLQEEGFGAVSYSLAHSHIDMWVHESENKVDMIKFYFETPYNQLDEDYQGNTEYHDTSSFQSFWNCITIDYMTQGDDNVFKEYCLYRSMFKKWWFGYIKSIYPNDRPISNNSVLVFTGREQIRKTSFFNYILPSKLRQIAFTTHGFQTEVDRRDVVKLASQNRILVWDEIEQYLNYKSESAFKKIIDGQPQSIIDKYEVVVTVFTPIAIYGGTSNKRKFQLSRSGNRRLFHIPVSWIDTDAISKLCWHPILCEMKSDYEEQEKIHGAPELLTTWEREFQTRLNYEISELSSLEYVLKEVYDFDYQFSIVAGGIPRVTAFREDKTHTILTLTQVHTDVSSKFPGKTFDFADLSRTVQSMCAEWTHTKFRSKVIIRPKGVIQDGMLIQSSVKKYILPPLRDKLEPSTMEKFK